MLLTCCDTGPDSSTVLLRTHASAPQVFGGTAGGASGPEALVLWQLIGAGVSMIVAPMAYSCKVRCTEDAGLC